MGHFPWLCEITRGYIFHQEEAGSIPSFCSDSNSCPTNSFCRAVAILVLRNTKLCLAYPGMGMSRASYIRMYTVEYVDN